MDHLLPYYLLYSLSELAGCGLGVGGQSFLCPLRWPFSPTEALG